MSIASTNRSSKSQWAAPAGRISLFLFVISETHVALDIEATSSAQARKSTRERRRLRHGVREKAMRTIHYACSIFCWLTILMQLEKTTRARDKGDSTRIKEDAFALARAYDNVYTYAHCAGSALHPS
ncbi:PREDICTED: uncharacterized protein LOC105448239 [Wasmannia auropunctata]|uniref:uncharacterized protein LOC105448239 n=1 Tax=Wasmannia auropunctata TaxID=64793 RepID=UPI0005EE3B83|nr:PREDICTED: uncharacterized protein LOC105448239 [Wasmannia auropunctata]